MEHDPAQTNPTLEEYFFERSATDECVSIDIAEKYKIMSLEGHNQATKRKKTYKNKQNGRLDWGINTRRTQHYSTTHAGRIGASTQPHISKVNHKCSRNREPATPTRPSTLMLSPRTYRRDTASTGNRKMRTTPRREDHCHAGSTAAMPLQHHSPPDGVIPQKPDLLKAASQSPPR